jgi:hypothetical protein
MTGLELCPYSLQFQLKKILTNITVYPVRINLEIGHSCELDLSRPLLVHFNTARLALFAETAVMEVADTAICHRWENSGMSSFSVLRV